MSAGTFAVVVNLNGGEANLDCLRSLIAGGMREDDLVFVDNASTDGSRELVKAAFPAATLLVNEANVGYGDGCNQGIRHALEHGAARVFLVNNDVTLPPETLERLEQELDPVPPRGPVRGIVGPRVLYLREPERVWCAGGRMTYRQNLSQMIGHRKPDGPQYRSGKSVDYVPGCAMLVRREVFESVGLLEGEYFAYHEDVEFCLKASAAGFGIWMVGEVAALHDAHSTTGGGYNKRRKYMMAVNTVWFLRKHGNPARWLSFLVFDVFTLPFVWLLRAPRGEGASVIAKARGTWDGLMGRRVTDRVLHEEALR